MFIDCQSEVHEADFSGIQSLDCFWWKGEGKRNGKEKRKQAHSKMKKEEKELSTQNLETIFVLEQCSQNNLLKVLFSSNYSCFVREQFRVQTRNFKKHQKLFFCWKTKQKSWRNREFLYKRLQKKQNSYLFNFKSQTQIFVQKKTLGCEHLQKRNRNKKV